MKTQNGLFDAKNQRVKAGDWVRVLQAPILRRKPEPDDKDMLWAFSEAIGKTFRVKRIDHPYLVLNLWPKLPGMHIIWIEPDLTVVTRRVKPKLKANERNLTRRSTGPRSRSRGPSAG